MIYNDDNDCFFSFSLKTTFYVLHIKQIYVRLFSITGIVPSYLSSYCGRFGEVMTSLLSMINTTVCVKEWDIRINAVRKEV